jgi:hypothetical protein
LTAAPGAKGAEDGGSEAASDGSGSAAGDADVAAEANGAPVVARRGASAPSPLETIHSFNGSDEAVQAIEPPGGDDGPHDESRNDCTAETGSATSAARASNDSAASAAASPAGPRRATVTFGAATVAVAAARPGAVSERSSAARATGFRGRVAAHRHGRRQKAHGEGGAGGGEPPPTELLLAEVLGALQDVQQQLNEVHMWCGLRLPLPLVALIVMGHHV